jgi:hypothetical protein
VFVAKLITITSDAVNAYSRSFASSIKSFSAKKLYSVSSTMSVTTPDIAPLAAFKLSTLIRESPLIRRPTYSRLRKLDAARLTASGEEPVSVYVDTALFELVLNTVRTRLLDSETPYKRLSVVFTASELNAPVAELAITVLVRVSITLKLLFCAPVFATYSRFLLGTNNSTPFPCGITLIVAVNVCVLVSITLTASKHIAYALPLVESTCIFIQVIPALKSIVACTTETS